MTKSHIISRRLFLAASTATLIMPLSAQASERVFYTPGLAEQAMASGEIVFLDFWTNWCSTCAAQHRALTRLRESNPLYDEKITFITVDWDEHAKSDISRRLAIPRRSTLVALKGDEEIGRIVAGTSTDQIKGLLDAALQAAE